MRWGELTSPKELSDDRCMRGAHRPQQPQQGGERREATRQRQYGYGYGLLPQKQKQKQNNWKINNQYKTACRRREERLGSEDKWAQIRVQKTNLKISVSIYLKFNQKYLCYQWFTVLLSHLHLIEKWRNIFVSINASTIMIIAIFMYTNVYLTSWYLFEISLNTHYILMK